MKAKRVLNLIGPFLLSVFIACLGPKKLTTDQSYLALKPVEQLPVYDLESLPVNFVVTIDNVADQGSSFKNRAEFYINDYLILPEEPVTNIQSTYHYRLKLQPGIYDIKGAYYALDGFTERKFEIKPQTKVMVKPNTLTKVNCTIEKNWDGTPAHQPLLFTVSYEPFSSTQRETVSVPPQNPTRTGSPNPEPKPPIPGPTPNRPHRPASDKLIVLQINTSPSGADITLDDRYVGQSPLRILVDRTSDHVLQISKEGYEDAIRILDRSQFGNEEVIHFVQKLNPKK